jgi:hypothetical protein
MPKKSDFGNFTPLAKVPPRRLLVASGGPPKTGKNHFGLTAPGPIFGQYFDPGGLEGMAEKFLVAPLGPKEIYQAQYRFNKRTDDQAHAKEVKAQFIADYEAALGWARTIQWDETEFYEVCRFAEFGRESAKGREYGPLNGEYRGLIQAAYDAGVNLHLIHKLKEKWEDDKPTGTMIASGFPQVAGIVQVNLRHAWSLEDGFQIEIASCRQNMRLAGLKADMSFTDLAMLVYPETEEGDWQ